MSFCGIISIILILFRHSLDIELRSYFNINAEYIKYKPSLLNLLHFWNITMSFRCNKIIILETIVNGTDF